MTWRWETDMWRRQVSSMLHKYGLHVLASDDKPNKPNYREASRSHPFKRKKKKLIGCRPRGGHLAQH